MKTFNAEEPINFEEMKKVREEIQKRWKTINEYLGKQYESQAKTILNEYKNDIISSDHNDVAFPQIIKYNLNL